MDRETRLKRMKFRARHRGTREADMLVGGWFDARSVGWNDAELDWFERFLEEQDVDIMAWALGTAGVPVAWQGPMMDDLKLLDFVSLKP